MYTAVIYNKIKPGFFIACLYNPKKHPSRFMEEDKPNRDVMEAYEKEWYQSKVTIPFASLDEMNQIDGYMCSSYMGDISSACKIGLEVNYIEVRDSFAYFKEPPVPKPVLKLGMIFDLYQDGHSTKRVMVISDKVVMDLRTQELIEDIDFENEVVEILIDDVFDL